MLVAPLVTAGYMGRAERPDDNFPPTWSFPGRMKPLYHDPKPMLCKGHQREFHDM